jgi:signal peptidase II
MPRRYRIFVPVLVLATIADQVTKYLARHHLAPGRPKPFLGSFWSWELSFNSGSAFGLFSSTGGARWILTAVALAACVAIVVFLHRAHDRQTWTAVALGLIFSGAVGNVADRLVYGHVTDFVVWRVGNFKWPTFNVADAALVVGVAILIIDMGREKKKA